MTETAVAPAPITDPMQKMQHDTLTQLIVQYNKVAEEVNAATGNKEDLAKTIREHEDFADLRNQIAELEATLQAQVDERVEARMNDSSGDTEALAKKAAEMKGTITTGVSFYNKLFGKIAAQQLPKVARIKGKSGGGGKAGGRRIRGYNWIVNLNGQITECDNAAGAAKLLGVVTTEQLQEQFFAKAGVDKVKDAPDKVIIVLDWPDTNEDGSQTQNHAEIEVYRTGPSGPVTNPGTPAATEAPADAAPEVPDNTVDEDAASVV
jgi:hypothetical protein